MATLNDPDVHKLLTEPNYAVVSTLNRDGSIHSTVAWIDVQDGVPAINSAKGRVWPTNLERDPRVSAVVIESGNPYNFVEIRGTAQEVDGADEHINGLTKKYIDQDEYPFRAPGEVRVKFEIAPEHIRHQKQG
ncbi:MAG: PPOX class F420-dependent oxidoreductase [Solirubrobacteraceae bacterium]